MHVYMYVRTYIIVTLSGGTGSDVECALDQVRMIVHIIRSYT